MYKWDWISEQYLHYTNESEWYCNIHFFDSLIRNDLEMTKNEREIMAVSHYALAVHERFNEIFKNNLMLSISVIGYRPLFRPFPFIWSRMAISLMPMAPVFDGLL